MPKTQLSSLSQFAFRPAGAETRRSSWKYSFPLWADDHGVRELWTSDRDFSRFPTLKYLWNHPDLSRETKEKIAYHLPW